jgi:hypothetical protein
MHFRTMEKPSYAVEMVTSGSLSSPTMNSQDSGG